MRARVAHQRHEPGALELEHRRLVQRLDEVGVAAREDFRQGTAHHEVVWGGLALPMEAFEGHGQRRLARGAGQDEGRRLGRGVALGQGQCSILGVGQQAVAIHRDAVLGAQEEQLFGLGRRLGDRGGADQLERLADGGHGSLGQLAQGGPAMEHLLAAAPGGNQADPHFH